MSDNLDLDKVFIEIIHLTQGDRNTLQNLKINNIKSLVRKFKENGISLEKITQVKNSMLLDEENTRFIEEEITRSKFRQKSWMEMLKFISHLFKKHDIQCVFIKILNLPYTIMTDIDILPLNPREELKALEILYKTGFRFFQFRLLAHPLKIMAIKTDNPEVSIDFYPEPVWIRKKIHDTSVIFSRRRISMVNGAEVTLPSPEDDLYLIGTHAYNHLRFTFAEISYGTNILQSNKDFDWEYLYNLSSNYGTADAIYAYLKVIDFYSRKFHRQTVVDDKVIKRFQRIRICRKIESWFKKLSQKGLVFPIQVPSLIACLYSSFYHCQNIIAHTSLTEFYQDFLTHYLTMSSKAILGRT